MKKHYKLLWRRVFTFLLPAFFAVANGYGQYCLPTFGTGCTFGDQIQSVNTTGGATNFTNNNTGCSTGSYTNYPALSCSQIQGQTITINMVAGSAYTQSFGVWIDWNGDSDFADAGESVYLSPATGASFSTTLTVPFGSIVGATRMRVRSNYFDLLTAGDACSNTSFGEVEDYVFNILASNSCTGQPTAGTAVTSASPVCPSVNYTVSLTGNTLAGGLTYQWQSSSNGTTYANITGATSSNYSTSQTANTYYQCIVTCTASGLTSTSSPILVNTNSFVNCYCTSNATSAADEEILNVSISTLNNSSTCATTGGAGSVQSQYSNYTATVPAPILAASASYPLSVSIGTCGGNYGNMTKVWIDYNQNGLFTDAGEMVYVSPAFATGPNVINTNITVPATATVGITRMRVVNVETTVATGVNPCGTYAWGETEDYFVNIAPVPTCPQPTALSLVAATTTTAQVAWTAGGSETQWQIQYGLAGFAIGTGTTVNVSTVSPYTLTGLTPNSFYTAYVRGICSAGDTSYWAGLINFNTYGQGQFMVADTKCPTAGFIDISTTGTATPFTFTSAAVGMQLPFTLLYQGQLQNNISLTNSGVVTFNNVTFFSNFNAAITAATVNGLYAHWDAMQVNGMGVYTQVIGTAPNRKFIVQWNAPLIFGSTDKVNVQLVIEEATQEIYFVYDDVNVGNIASDKGASATIGVAGPNQDIQLSFNNANYLTSNSCAHFYYTNCPKPTNFVVSTLSQEDVSFAWTAGLANETNWTIIYGPAGFDPTTTGPGIFEITSTTPTASISGLTQLTQYDVYIYSDCSPTLQSEAALFGTFLTLPFCSNPSAGVMTSDIDSIFASWSWTASGVAYPATGFNLQYGFSGFQLYSPNSTEVAAGGINFADTVVNANLLGGGVYQVYVQAVCGTDTSQFIGPFSVTMPLSNDSVCGAEMLSVNGPTYVFNNTGATVQLNETNIAPTATGAQTTNGWIASTLNGTTWFKFVAPTSGKMRINCTSSNNAWNTYNGQVAVYENVGGCSDFANFTLNSANDNAIGSSSVAPNYTICGLTAGTTYYMMFDGSGPFGAYAIKLTSIDLEAGTANPVVSVCAGDSVDLFTAITGNQANGVWTAQLASAATGLTGSTFQSAGLAFQTFNFQYRLTDGCAYDSIVGQVKIFPPSSAGSDGTVTVCRNQPFNLLAGLEGNADLGGQWYNPNNATLASPSIFSSNIPGQYNYSYVTGNNVCPDDTAGVLVNVLANCNWLGLDETEMSNLSLYPNPTNGLVYISNEGSSVVYNYTILDAQGRVIANANNAIKGAAKTEINLQGKETGIYMIRVFNENSEKVFRVVLQ
jgi:hypothetical protein